MNQTIYVLNGPNLNLLGVREPKLYGHTTLVDVEALCQRVAGDLGLACTFRQSNHEGVLVDWVHEARGVSEFLCKRVGLQLTEMRSPN